MTLQLLSVLLMGMVPVGGPAVFDPVSVSNLSIAQPAVELPHPKHNAPRLALSASGVMITDLDSGQEIFGLGSTKRRSIASLTKLMTAIVIVEHHQLNEWVTIPADISSVEGQVAHLKPGEHYMVGDLLSAMLVYSANDAAVSLAEFHSKTQSAFVRQMNQRAQSLGLRNTHFENPDGLDSPEHYSTAQDLVWLATFALRHPAIQERMSLPEVTIESREGTALTFQHTLQLLHQQNAVVAGKTGTTDDARECAISIVDGENGHKYVVVILGSNKRYQDMHRVLQLLAKLPA